MKKYIGLFIIGILAIVALYLFISQNTGKPPAPLPITYTNSDYGISFTYPSDYILSEGERGNGLRTQYVITLIKKEDSAPRVDSEGPTAITFNIYQNNLDQMSLVGWLTGTNVSNYKLSNGAYASTTVAGTEAISYGWSGLYEGKTVAWRHRGNIIAASVTYLSPEDENLDVFNGIISSLSFTREKLLSQEDAVSTVKNMYPELASYPSENLPPKTIEAEMVQNGAWRIAFLMLGSGRPGILGAQCYIVTPSKEVTKIGELTIKTTEVVNKIDLATCKAK